ELDVLTAAGAPTVRFRPLERFPAVTRDLSVQIDAGVPAARLLDDVRAAGGPFLREGGVAGPYGGPPRPPGRVSLTLGLRFQAAERTLTGDEGERARAEVVARLRAAGHEIRE